MVMPEFPAATPKNPLLHLEPGFWEYIKPYEGQGRNWRYNIMIDGKRVGWIEDGPEDAEGAD